MDQFTVGNGLDAVKSSPHAEPSQLWNLGLAPFSAEAASWRGSSKPATGGVMETGWALNAGRRKHKSQELSNKSHIVLS